MHNFEARAPIGTTVKHVLVKEGDHVKKGQLLVELNAANARSQAAQANAQVKASQADISALELGGTQEELLTLQAQLVKARGDLDTAQHNLDALKRLQQTGAASPGEVRAAQNQLDAAAAQVKLLETKQKERYSKPEVARVQAVQSQAETAYSAAEDVLNQLLIRAPFDGIVYSLPVKQGAYVNPGDLVLQQADLSQVLVRAFVDEPDVARLSPGERIEVTWDAMPGRTWTGWSAQFLQKSNYMGLGMSARLPASCPTRITSCCPISMSALRLLPQSTKTLLPSPAKLFDRMMPFLTFFRS